MPRKSREISGTGIYHVMMRGTNRQNIFEDREDYLRFFLSWVIWFILLMSLGNPFRSVVISTHIAL